MPDDLKKVPEDKGPTPASRLWRFLESAGGAALIAGVIGAMAVSIATALFQRSTSRRDFEQAWMRDIVRGAFDVSGRCIQTSADLLFLNSKIHDHSNKQWEAAAADFNASDTEWRKQRETLGLLVSYYYRDAHAEQSRILAAWEDQVKALDSLMSCTQTMEAEERPSTSEIPCQTERDSAREKQRTLRNDLLQIPPGVGR